MGYEAKENETRALKHNGSDPKHKVRGAADEGGIVRGDPKA